MAGTIRPNDMNVSTTPTLSSSALPTLSNLQTDLPKKQTAPRTPRIDIEPLYAAVKGGISDTDWIVYKKSLGSFLVGNLNQEEISFTLSKILTTPALEHAHNALVTGIYANLSRDPPEGGIASWVSSSDKPMSGATKGTGDESEKRLKHEVMQISRRERKRLKTIPTGERGAAASGDAHGQAGIGATGPVQQYIDARLAKEIDTGPSSIGGGFGKTSKHTDASWPMWRWMLTHNRLGARNPEALHVVSFRRNPRIPHRHYNLIPIITYMLRGRLTTGSYDRLP